MSNSNNYDRWVFKGGLTTNDATWSENGDKVFWSNSGRTFKNAEFLARKYLPFPGDGKEYPNSTIKRSEGETNPYIELLASSENHTEIGDHSPQIIKIRKGLKFHPISNNEHEYLLAEANAETNKHLLALDDKENDNEEARLESWTLEVIERGTIVLSTQVWKNTKNDNLYKTQYCWWL